MRATRQTGDPLLWLINKALCQATITPDVKCELIFPHLTQCVRKQEGGFVLVEHFTGHAIGSRPAMMTYYFYHSEKPLWGLQAMSFPVRPISEDEVVKVKEFYRAANQALYKEHFLGNDEFEKDDLRLKRGHTGNLSSFTAWEEISKRQADDYKSICRIEMRGYLIDGPLSQGVLAQ